jgi:hypothetical protein
VLAYRRLLYERARERLAWEFPEPENGEYWVSREACIHIEMAASQGEAYYVSRDMTAVAIAAAKTMPEQVLRRDDLPSEDGVLVYDRPVGTFPTADPSFDSRRRGLRLVYGG